LQREPALADQCYWCAPDASLCFVPNACAMKLKSKRSISFPEDGQMLPAWLTLTVTLMICYATIVALGLLRALDL
jgi:hypothetical protein